MSEKIITNREYEIITSIPENFEIWAIGENMKSDEYLPIVTGTGDDSIGIDENRIYAIKADTETVKKLRYAATFGATSPKNARNEIKLINNGGYEHLHEADRQKIKQICTDALPYLDKLFSRKG